MSVTQSQIPRLIQHELDYHRIKFLIDSQQCDSLMFACQLIRTSYATMYAYIKKYHNDFVCSRVQNGKRILNCKVKQQKLKIKNSDLDVIKHLYFDQKLSMQEIAKMYSCTSAVVCSYFKKHNIRARTKSECLKMRFENPTFREKVRLNNIKTYLKRRKYGTKPERDFAKYCKLNNILYEEQYRKVGNGHPYDFFLPQYNLIVEIDGTYWHSSKEQQLKDKKHVDDAVKKGYNIIRIDTTELAAEKGDYSKWLMIYLKKNTIIQA